jgi:hypothetical protein
MKRLCVLVCALFAAPGCASMFEGPEWDEFHKEMRGDNMQMRGDFSAPTGGAAQGGSPKSPG